MKLWHDDVRPAPEGWVWAKNNEEAQAILETGRVKEISLDHDLGAVLEEDGIFAKGTAEETGLHLVDWMVFNNLVPQRVIIHSWNPAGAARMLNVFRAKGYHGVIYEPYKHFIEGPAAIAQEYMKVEVQEELNEIENSAKLES